jgi:hypothetical protein
MAIIDNVFRTVTCDGPSCKKTVTFEQKQDQSGVKEAMEKEPWIKTCRVTQQVSGGRNFVYCSDTCELEGVASGKHNPEERKVIVAPQGANALQLAAAQAAAAEAATKALKEGAGVTLQGS